MIKKNQGGALIGILVVVVIMGFLYLGSLFFFGENKESSPEAPADVLENARDTIEEANQQTEEKNQAIEDEEEDGAIEEEKDKDKNEKDTEVKSWRTLESEQIGISLNYPGSWYYNINHEEAKEEGYDLIIGFASSSKIWEMDLPYPIELVVVDKDTEVEGGYVQELTQQEDKNYILRTEKQEYKKITDQMAESFEFINS